LEFTARWPKAGAFFIGGRFAMVARKIEIAPELIAEGKRLYEQTLTPLNDIAAVMGITRGTLAARIKEWGWSLRRPGSRGVDIFHAMRGGGRSLEKVARILSRK
jgi:hypothetical protein